MARAIKIDVLYPSVAKAIDSTCFERVDHCQHIIRHSLGAKIHKNKSYSEFNDKSNDVTFIQI